MKKYFVLSMCLTMGLLLTGCGTQSVPQQEDEDTLHLVATTYPVYIALQEVTQGADNIQITRLNTGAVSCLHNYTLTVGDMKQIEQADYIFINGAGLETFLDGVLSGTAGAVVDCSQGIPLLETVGHDHIEGVDDHDHGHWDPHYWMNPADMAQMMVNIQQALEKADQEQGALYQENARKAAQQLEEKQTQLLQMTSEVGETIPGIITFHDGFQYFSQAYGFPLLASIEEEEGSEASAKEINAMTALVKEYHLPIIFTEQNGSDATANAIARETGCEVAALDLLMDGPEDGRLEDYLGRMEQNVVTVMDGFVSKEGNQP